MGESSACLTRSFSQPSPTSGDEEKGNPLQRALTTSVSFGRFMSESLDWERWSAFTQNRYLEEVSKFSKPGSVAEKKAYFEAHYKRRRAAALLEQQNAAANDISERNIINKVENNASSNFELAQRDNCVITENIEEEVQNSNTVCDVGENDGCEIERKIEDAQMGCVERVNESSILVENKVEIMNHLKNDGEIGDIVSKQEYNVCEKDDSTMTNSVPPIEKKPEVSSLNISTNSGAYKHAPSIKPPKIPISKNGARDLSNKRRSNATSLHMSINLASCSGETRKPASPNTSKITNSRLMSTPIRKSKNSVLPQTSTRASVSGIFKHQSATLLQENRRIMTTDCKLQSLSTNNSKSSSIFVGSKSRSTTVSSAFTFKSEERAAKRKEFFEKLEHKLKSKETDKHQLNAKSQVKARSEFKSPHDPIASKAKKTVENPQIIESSSNLMKKQIPSTRPFSPKTHDRAVFKVQDNVPRPPWRVSGKPEGLKDVNNVKNNRPPISAAKSFWKKSTRENASPNIQL